MKTYFNHIMAGAAFLALASCGGDGGKMDIANAGPAECFPKKAQINSGEIAKYKAAIFIGIESGGSVRVGYATPAFQTRMDGTATQAELARLVAGATDADKRFYPTSDRRPTLPNPLDFDTARNITVAFVLEPEAWTFATTGFRLKAEGVEEGRFTPFAVSPPAAGGNVITVDYDREEATPDGQCQYEYELVANIGGSRSGLDYSLPIILDPDWGNGNSGGMPPPGGPPPEP